MRIQPGQPAKNFTAEDIAGNVITFEDYAGRCVMLSFYRYAACPLCNLRVHDLIRLHGSYIARNLYLIAVFKSPRESIRKYVGKQDIPFPVIADPDLTVQVAYYGSDIGDHLPIKKINAWIDRSQKEGKKSTTNTKRQPSSAPKTLSTVPILRWCWG